MSNRIEIVIDEDADHQVELYMLDENGVRIEGGTFELNDFMDHVLKFYNENY